MKILQLSPRYIPFDLDKTLDCGQVFRWHKTGDDWTGVIDRKVVTVREEGLKLIYDGIDEKDLVKYFNLDLDLARVISTIRNSIKKFTGGETDPLFDAAEKAGEGLRIIRQDPWECLISFICSQNSNIPSIRRRISLLCSRYGRPLTDGQYSFPVPEDLAKSDTDHLRLCSTGYRALYLSKTSGYLLENPDFLTSLASISLKEARTELIKLPGVGPKVADCVLLFAYNHYQTVPVDVWIRSIITCGYPLVHTRSGEKKECSYNDIVDFCRAYFGIYAGYAQQLLFAARRDLPEIFPESSDSVKEM